VRSKPVALRLVSLFALGVCAASLTDDLLAGGTFCPFRSACAAVTSSPYGRLLGVPWSAVGLAGFGLVFGLTLFPDRRAFALVRPLALLAGLAGLALILVQVLVLGRTCPLCLLADASGLGLAALGGVGRTAPGAAAGLPPSRRWAWLGAALVAAAAPPVWGWLHFAPPVPDLVKASWAEGRVNVVEVMDFDCRFCRHTEPVLTVFRREAGGQIHFVRLVAPLPRYPHSRDAARAYMAAAAQGKGDAMAVALFAAPGRDAGECRKLAGSAGVNLDAYDRVVADPATDAAFEATCAWVDAEGAGLPLVWVQDRLIRGVPNLEDLRAAVRAAARVRR
jgi:uncharacterized membrane protein